MRIGIVCPYSFDVPGGVQNHVRDLAETLIALGPRGQRARPGRRGRAAAAVRGAGRAGRCRCRYNGSVARLVVRPDLRRPGAAVAQPRATSTCCTCTSRSRRACPCWRCCPRDGPVVATFHTAMTRSRALPPAQGVLQLVLEKITARIAVSALARKVQVEHLGGGAWEIPNGVAVAAVRRRRSRCPAGPATGRRRSASWAGSPSRARASRPAATAFADAGADAAGTAAAGGRPRRSDEVCEDCRRRRATGSPSWAWSPRRTRRGCCAASTSTSRRTPAASPSA